MYCARCQDVYLPQKAKFDGIDGAFFGTSFAHMFVVNYPLLFIKPKQEFTGTIYGFKMHSSSVNHPLKMEFLPSTNAVAVMPRPIANFVSTEVSKGPARKFIVNVQTTK